MTDVDRAKEIIGSPGMLELKLVEQGPAASREDLLRATGGVVPPDMEVAGRRGDGDTAGGGPLYYLVRRVAAVTGQDLRTARVQLDENNMPAVGFTLNPAGGAAFARVTGENVGRSLAIVLDETVQSAPTHQLAHRRRRSDRRAASPRKRRRTLRSFSDRARCPRR